MDCEAEFADQSDEEDWMDTNWSVDEVSDDIKKTDVPYNSLKKEDTIREETVVKMDDSLMSRMRLNDNKAGMEGLDKEKINQIILDASKGSKFYENERKKEEQVRKRIQEQKEKNDKITQSQLKQGVIQADMLLEEFELARDLSRTIVHIDMDAFYAAVEIRDNPTLKDKPMAVGGNDMLSTSNYHARKYGVRAAMPGFIGKKLCPELIIVPLNFEKYTMVSKQVREIMADYDPNFCPMSLDEAYLDITDHLQKRKMMSDVERTYLCRKCDNHSVQFCLCDLNDILRNKIVCENVSASSKKDSETTRENHETPEENSNNVNNGQSECLNDITVCPICGKPFPDYDVVVFGSSPDDIVQEMRLRIEQKTRLTASAGIAPNMMLAKVCSDKNKPNGQYRILATVDAVMGFIKDLPIRKISGIGKVSEQMLNSIGVVTCTDLYQKRGLLYHLYSQISFNYFMRICLGIGSTTVERDSERKSISTERTFSEINKPADLYNKCYELCEALSDDLVDEQLRGKTVTIKLKTVNFEVKTRAHTIPELTSDVDVIFAAAKDLLKTEIQNVAPQPLRLRLMGVRMSGLLHQSLCKNKQKQNTITGLIKKLGYKSAQNNCKTSLPMESETAKPSVKSDNQITLSMPDCSEISTANKGVTCNANHNQGLPEKSTDMCKSDDEWTTPISKSDDAGNTEVMIKVPSYSLKEPTEPDNSGENGLCGKSVSLRDKKPSGEASYSEDYFCNEILLEKKSDIGVREEKDYTNFKNETTRENICDVISSSDLIASKTCSDLKKFEFSECTGCTENSHSGCNKKLSPEECRLYPSQKDVEASECTNEDKDTVEMCQYRVHESCGEINCENVEYDNEYYDNNSENRAQEEEILGHEVRVKESISVDKSQSNVNATIENKMEKLCEYMCPICRNEIKCENLSLFNQHIDICLNKQVVMDCSRSENLRANMEHAKQMGKSQKHKGLNSSPSSLRKSKQKIDLLKSPKVTMSKTKSVNVTSSCLNTDKNKAHEKEGSSTCPSLQICVPEKSDDEENKIGRYSEENESEGHSINGTKLVCPVCFMEQTGKSLDDFNTHVDSCLSKGTISDILKEQKHERDIPVLKRSVIDISDKQPSGKRKRSNSGQVTKSGPTKIRSIDSFFKL